MAILFGTQCPFSEKTSAEPWQHYREYNRHLAANGFDHVKASLMDGVPVEWCPVLGHGHQWSHIGGNVREKVSQIVHQSYESLDVVVIAESVPLLDVAEFIRLGVDTIFVNDVAQAVHLVCVEIAFGPFKEEGISM